MPCTHPRPWFSRIDGERQVYEILCESCNKVVATLDRELFTGADVLRFAGAADLRPAGTSRSNQ